MEKNGFVTATELGTTNKLFVVATKNFAVATKRFVNRTKHSVVVTTYFCYPYIDKWFCWYNKTLFSLKIKISPKRANCSAKRFAVSSEEEPCKSLWFYDLTFRIANSVKWTSILCWISTRSDRCEHRARNTQGSSINYVITIPKFSPLPCLKNNVLESENIENSS